MGTIPQELVSFKNSVSPSLDTMKTTSTTLQDKIQEMMTANDRAKEGVNTYYQSENKDTVINKFTRMNDIYKKINSSLKDDFDKILKESEELVKLIEELEQINEDIKNLQTVINSESGIDTASQQRITTANSNLITKQNEFTTKCNEAKTKFDQLKSMDESLSFVSEFTPDSSYLAKLSQLGYGTFEKKTFRASNGITLSYYVYVPDYGEEVEGLPVHLYLHGSGESGDGALSTGLPKMLRDKTITPSGIVICAQAPTSSAFYDKSYQKALVELTDQVAEDNNGDKNKISLSGHSYGAIVGYQMIGNFPNHFAAFMPISGNSGGANEGTTSTKIWAFHGSNDLGNNGTDYNNTKNLVASINKSGGDATLYTYQGEGHGRVQNYTFERTFQYKDGETYNPLEWAFLQSLEA